jgi:nitroreductase
MEHLTRRLFLASAAIAGTTLPRAGFAGSAAEAPIKEGGMSLIEALSLRRSTRLYSADPIDDVVLSTLLWAAFGINRPESGGHTAPSWHGSNETDIHVATADGVRKFDPASQSMTRISDRDVRAKASPQPFVGTAPVVLIYIADRARMYKASDEEQTQSAHVDAAIIAQNVYLFCAANGLGTCLVGGADKEGLARSFQLPASRFVTFVQPLGYPKKT